MKKTLTLLMALMVFISTAVMANPPATPIAAHLAKPVKSATAKTFRTTKAVRFDCGSCWQEGYKCINNNCEFGNKYYTHYMSHPPYYICFYRYQWSDGSISGEYWEHSPAPCI